ncbi:hypothetical protein SAY87_019064 [Trapa incisa]|uniref:Uncharacterized protein n=1 Tax=Trapa incisa TaxID=236973 RepID=A0AAN7K555_9MYRT|nr:hypothetical protein SAY87_019064 [Trapa incisa]
MAILYAMVARGSTVLAESNATATNAGAIAREMLEKRRLSLNDDGCISSSYEGFNFHIKHAKEAGLTFLCAADDAAGSILASAFLDDIRERFVRAYGRTGPSSPAYAMNDGFSRILREQMEYYSDPSNAESIKRLKGEIDQVRGTILEDLNKNVDRDLLKSLLDEADDLKEEAGGFRVQDRNTRSTAWWRSVKLSVALIIVILVVAYVILALVCHGLALPSCTK